MRYNIDKERGNEMVRIYGIERKIDGKIVFTTASRSIALHKISNSFDRREYRLVIIERG